MEASTQIMLFAPQARLEEELYARITRTERVDYYFNISCWFIDPFLRKMSTFTNRVLSINAPKRLFHPKLGEYTRIRVHLLIGPKRKAISILIPKAYDDFNRDQAKALLAYHKAQK